MIFLTMWLQRSRASAVLILCTISGTLWLYCGATRTVPGTVAVAIPSSLRKDDQQRPGVVLIPPLAGVQMQVEAKNKYVDLALLHHESTLAPGRTSSLPCAAPHSRPHGAGSTTLCSSPALYDAGQTTCASSAATQPTAPAPKACSHTSQTPPPARCRSTRSAYFQCSAHWSAH